MFPLSTSFLIMSVKYVTASSVERLDRNPNWKDDSKPLFSRCDNNCLYTILSKILGNTGSIDIQGVPKVRSSNFMRYNV